MSSEESHQENVSFPMSALGAGSCQFHLQKGDGPIGSIFTETSGSSYVGNKSTKQLVDLLATVGV